MAETVEAEKYLKCSNCKCKYHNKEETIINDFGYNRLGERFKCCIKCRNRNIKYRKKSDEKNKSSD